MAISPRLAIRILQKLGMAYTEPIQRIIIPYGDCSSHIGQLSPSRTKGSTSMVCLEDWRESYISMMMIVERSLIKQSILYLFQRKRIPCVLHFHLSATKQSPEAVLKDRPE